MRMIDWSQTGLLGRDWLTKALAHKSKSFDSGKQDLCDNAECARREQGWRKITKAKESPFRDGGGWKRPVILPVRAQLS